MEERKFKKGRGRPTKFDPEIANTIIEFIRAGNYVETAAAAAGIVKSTLYDWLKRGKRAKSGVFHNFSNAVEKAMAEAEVVDVTRIGIAAKEYWQAAAWRLERKFPKKWGRKIEVAGDQNAPLVVKTWAEVVKELSEKEKGATQNELDSDTIEEGEGQPGNIYPDDFEG